MALALALETMLGIQPQDPEIIRREEMELERMNELSRRKMELQRMYPEIIRREEMELERMNHEMSRRKEMELERMISDPEISIREPGADEATTTVTRLGRTPAANRSDMWYRYLCHPYLCHPYFWNPYLCHPYPEISIREPGADEATTTVFPDPFHHATLDDCYFRSVQEQNAVPCYKTNAETPGICLIINNRDFYKDPVKPEAKELKKRNGTDKDAFRLIDTFGNLGFKINYKENLSDTDMVNAVNQLALSDHSDYDCFVCCILSHGTEGAIYGSNGCLLDVKKFTAPFRAQSCPSLSGKPKLFFMQACQGQEKQLGCGIDMEPSQAETIPNEADFLLGYATVPGFASFRSRSAGSLYIRKLTEILNKYAKIEDIHSLLLLVNHEVGKENANMEDGTYKQSPALFSSLRKKLIFQ